MDVFLLLALLAFAVGAVIGFFFERTFAVALVATGLFLLALQRAL